jgi:hypothetical protein
MSAAAEPLPVDDGLPRIMKYCKRCQMETPHQIRRGEGVSAVICMPCWFRAMAYELERD